MVISITELSNNILLFLYKRLLSNVRPSAQFAELANEFSAIPRVLYMAVKKLESDGHVSVSEILTDSRSLPEHCTIELTPSGASLVETASDLSTGHIPLDLAPQVGSAEQAASPSAAIEAVEPERRARQFVHTAFIIMNFHNPETERVYSELYKPLLESYNCKATRIDHDHEGGTLAFEIFDRIKNADLIIADLTAERPNCYLEVGYVLGISKTSNQILLANKTHDPRAAGRTNEMPRVHFDLDSHHIIYWDLDDLHACEGEIKRRVEKILGRATPADKRVHEKYESWLSSRK